MPQEPIILKRKLIIYSRIADIDYVVTEMKWLIKQAQKEHKTR